MIHKSFAVFALVCGVVIAAPASAEVYRLPKTGAPAFSIDVPTGWTAVYDEFGNLSMAPKDQTTGLVVKILTDDNMKTVPTSVYAANIMKSAGVDSYAPTGPGAVGGVAGDTFEGAVKNTSDMVISVRLIIAKLDSKHAAAAVVLKGPDILGAEAAAVETLYDTLKLVR